VAVFTSGELEVMQVLWEHGKLKPAEIQKKFPRPIKNAALRSQLLILLEKGHVKREKIGKAYYYTAKTPPQRTLKHMVHELANVFFSGSRTALIAQLIQMENLSEDDIRELQIAARGEVKSKGDKK